jgi:gamma-glutamylcyclotransferase (GGCT)/AIG2-like uncharacterized protein YtfP
MDSKATFLFVYGTLMDAATSRIATYLHQNSDLIGRVSIPGKLWDLGSYPAATYEPNAHTKVFGQLLQLRKADKMLPHLDEYEGIGTDLEYERKLIDIELNKKTYRTWLYHYIGSTSLLTSIPHGDYRQFLAQPNCPHWEFIRSV